MDAIYYENQADWTKEEYCYLHRYLHRMFYYYQKHEKDIANLDTERMSDRTKALIYCIIQYYHMDFLFTQFSNLQSLKNMKPLEEELVLDDSTKTEDDIYRQMNVVY